MSNTELRRPYSNTFFVDTWPVVDRLGPSKLLSSIDSLDSPSCFDAEILSLLRGEPFGMTTSEVSSPGFPTPASFKHQIRDCDMIGINLDAQMGPFDVHTFLQPSAEYDRLLGQKLAYYDSSPGRIEVPTVMWPSPSSSSTSDQFTRTSDTSPLYTSESSGSVSEFATTPSPNWNHLGYSNADEPSPPAYGFMEASPSRIQSTKTPPTPLISPVSIDIPWLVNQPIHSGLKDRQKRMDENGKIRTKPQAFSERLQADHALLQDAFTPRSRHPDHRLRALLDRILESEFLKNHQLEPTYDSLEGYMLLVDIPKHPAVPDGSIYLPFIDPYENRCLMCGNTRDCVSRALGCVRRHLGHRPYHCPGSLGDCKKCRGSTARFFTQAHLHDHIRGQFQKQTCIKCGMELRRGGMRRHWRSKHPRIDFPYDDYPTYRQLNASILSK